MNTILVLIIVLSPCIVAFISLLCLLLTRSRQLNRSITPERYMLDGYQELLNEWFPGDNQ
jgi:hypothetical protein